MAAQSLLSQRHGERDDITAESTEQTPLISQPSSASRLHANRTVTASSTASLGDALPNGRSPRTAFAILCFMIFLVCAQGGFYNMSLTRIFEDILCRQYYDQIHSKDEPIDETMCKHPAIQSKLAYLFAILESFNAALGITAALPWGIMADKIGRRPVFVMGLTGMSISILWIMVVGWFPQTFSPRLIWLSPIFYLLGGGNPVLSATVHSITIDMMPESERASCFMRIHGASMVGNLLSPALASIMMASTGPWPTIFLSFLLTGLPGPLIFLVPETLKQRHVDDSDEPDSGTLKSHLTQSLHELKKSATMFRFPSMIIILLITMLQVTLVICTLQFLSQFASKRYNIPIADTGYIQSAYGISFIAVSFIILPYVSSALLKPSAPAFLRFDDDKQRDLFLARSSYVASMVGTFILGLSGSVPGFVFGLIILAFGVSGEGFLKSIATLYVTAEQRSRLFTILALAAMSSNLWASPALAALFSAGMRLDGIWIGLPYFGVFGLCILMFASSLFIKAPPSPGVDEESDSGHEPFPE
ncbi:major facilitator superfamily domain-containing protein [Nemania sp. NC0429]|nr:major facilitator superfamily domain-containing protein [Nemania sp. NC0429]